MLARSSALSLALFVLASHVAAIDLDVNSQGRSHRSLQFELIC